MRHVAWTTRSTHCSWLQAHNPLPFPNKPSDPAWPPLLTQAKLIPPFLPSSSCPFLAPPMPPRTLLPPLLSLWTQPQGPVPCPSRWLCHFQNPMVPPSPPFFLFFSLFFLVLFLNYSQTVTKERECCFSRTGTMGLGSCMGQTGNSVQGTG